MKQFLTALTAVLLFMACNDEKSTEGSDKAQAKKESSSISYPYTATYSSDFSMGDANHSKMVLDLFKMWEDNKVDEMKTLLADSVWINFPDGYKFKDNTVDSMIKFAKEYRKTLSSVRTNMDGWMPVRANDKKQDFVLTWGTDYIKNNEGKEDSISVHAYFLIVNNKIRGWSEFQQKLTPPAMK